MDSKFDATILDIIMAVFQKFGVTREVVLQGGYLVNKVLKSRATIDIDLSMSDILTWDRLLPKLHNCGKTLINLGIADEYNIKDPNPESGSCGRFKLYKDSRVVSHVDFGVIHLDYGIEERLLPLELKKDVVTDLRINCFRMERVLSDKVCAILSRQQMRRTKDLFDIYFILSNCSLSYLELYRCLTLAGFKLGYVQKILNADSPAEFPEEYRYKYSVFTPEFEVALDKVWENHDANRGQDECMAFADIVSSATTLKVLKSFLQSLYDLDGTFQEYTWDNTQMCWTKV